MNKFLTNLSQNIHNKLSNIRATPCLLPPNLMMLLLILFFIDGDHSYEGCKADIEAWLPKLREGGVMAGHDYEHPQFPGVKKSVDEIFDEVEVFSDMVWLIRKK